MRPFNSTRSLLACMVAIAAPLVFPMTAMGCAGPIGAHTVQDAAKIDKSKQAPTNVDWVDPSAGSMALSGTGGGQRMILTGDEVNTHSVGLVPRTLLVDRKNQKIVLNSATDITAEGVELTLNDAGDVVGFRIAKFGTSSSEPARAINEAYPALAEVWKNADQATRDVWIQQIKSMEAIAPDVRQALVALLTGIP